MCMYGLYDAFISGKIVKLETLHMLGDVIDPDVCCWNEQPDKSRDFISFVRLLYIFKKDGLEDQKYGDIGRYRILLT